MTSMFKRSNSARIKLDEKRARTELEAIVQIKKDTEAWQPIFGSFLNSVPPRSPQRFYKDKRVLDVTLGLIHNSLSRPKDLMLLLAGFERMIYFTELYKQVSTCDLTPVILCLGQRDPGVVVPALDVLRVVVAVPKDLGLGKASDGYEVRNKEVFARQGGFDGAAFVLRNFGRSKAENTLRGVLDMVHSILVARQATTPYDDVMQAVEKLTPLVHRVFELCRHDNRDIQRLATSLIRTMMEESSAKTYPQIQKAALKSGALLWMFRFAIQTHGSSTSQADRERMQISREIFGLFSDDNPPALALLRRVVPEGMTYKLNPKTRVATNSVAPKVESGGSIRSRRGTVNRLSVLATKNRAFERCNWPAFFNDFEQDHATPTLIWDKHTREELRRQVNEEVVRLDKLRMATPPGQDLPKWDHAGFAVNYHSLAKELKVGSYYLRRLIPVLSKATQAFPFPAPDAFVTELYNACVVNDDVSQNILILQTMELVISQHLAVVADAVPMEYLAWLLGKSQDSKLREAVYSVLELVFVQSSVAQRFINAGGIHTLMRHMLDAHAVEKGDKAGAEIPPEEQDSVDPSTALPRSKRRKSLLLHLLYVIESLCRHSYRARVAINEDPQRYFQWVVRMILCDNFDITAKAVHIVSMLLESYPDMQPHVYKTGMFHFIVAQLSKGATVRMVRLLRQYHKVQAFDKTAREKQASFLTFFMPQPLLDLLDSSTAAEWKRHITSDYTKPKIVWKKKMLKWMSEQTREGLQPFIKKVKEKPDTLFVYAPPRALVYPELKNELFLGGIYVKYFNLVPDTPLDSPSAFNAALHEWQEKKNLSKEDLALILAAVGIMTHRYPGQKGSDQYEGWPTLLEILSQDLLDKESFTLISTAVNSAYSLLTSPSEGERNTRLFAKENGVRAIASLADRCVLAATGKARSLLLKLLEIITAVAPSQEAQEALVHEDALVTLIVKLARDTSGNGKVVVQAMKALVLLCRNDKMQEVLTTRGVLLYMIDTAVLAEVKEGHFTMADHAAQVLAAMVGLHPTSYTPPNATNERLLRMLLTRNLYRFLSTPMTFLQKARGTSHVPDLVWNDTTRDELRAVTLREIERLELGDVPTWDYQDFEFSFASLQDQLNVGGVYVHLFNEMPDYELADFAAFITDLLESFGRLKSQLDTLTDSASFDVRAQANALTSVVSQHPDLLPVLSARLRASGIASMLIDIDSETDFAQIKSSLLEMLHAVVGIQGGAVVLLPFLSHLHTLLHTTLNNWPQLNLILTILTALARNSYNAVARMRDTGTVVSVLGLFCSCPDMQVRLAAAQLLGVLVRDANHGESLLAVLSALLSPKFDSVLRIAADEPSKLVAFYSSDHDTPVLVWNSRTRKELLALLKQDTPAVLEWLRKKMDAPETTPDFKWDYASLMDPKGGASRYKRPSLENELVVAGIYVRNFNTNPFWKVDSQRFLEALMDSLRTWFSYYRETTKKEEQIKSVKFIQMMWQAVMHILDSNPPLRRHPLVKKSLPFIFLHFSSVGIDNRLKSTALSVLGDMAKHRVWNESIEMLDMVKSLVPLLKTFPEGVPATLTILLELVRHRTSARLVLQLRAVGLIVFALDLIMNHADRQVHTQCAELLMALAAEVSYGRYIKDTILQFLTPKFEFVFESRPEVFVDALGKDHSIAPRIWDAAKREELGKFLSQEAGALSKLTDNWDGKSDRWPMNKLSKIWPDFKAPVYGEGLETLEMMSINSRTSHGTSGRSAGARSNGGRSSGRSTGSRRSSRAGHKDKAKAGSFRLKR